jgi:hypothetical protein
MAFLTILGQMWEARARPGHGDHESPANQTGLTTRRDSRVDARGPAGVRTTFARLTIVASERTRGAVMAPQRAAVRVPGEWRGGRQPRSTGRQ